MKKLLALLLTAVLLTACSGTPVISPSSSQPQGAAESSSQEESSSEAPEAALPADGESVKTGLAVLPSVASSKDATAEEPGLAQSDITLVAVTVDGNGVITGCAIDSIQAKINFDQQGAITTDLSTTFPTKGELGDGYGMKAASAIGKEWYEQADALAQYAVGKTAEDLRGIALTQDGKAADADLAASVSIAIGGYVDGIVQAAESATYLGASQGDTISLGAVTTMADSKNATAEEEGLAQAYGTVAAVTSRDGVISSCIIDAVQCNVNMDAAGKITTDLAAAPLTKNQLGEDYGMKAASSIGKEWYEQAAAFAQYVVGKTADEVTGIAVTESGAAADADLAASVTVSIGAFQQVVAAAA